MNKEERREYNRVWMKEDRLKNPEKYKRIEVNWRDRNPAKRLIISTRQSARLKKLEHNITVEDLILPEKCPLLGIPIDYSAGTGKTMDKPSVDRIDPSKGYIKGNVEVMSTLANTMKSKATREQLLLFAKNILERYDNNMF